MGVSGQSPEVVTPTSWLATRRNTWPHITIFIERANPHQIESSVRQTLAYAARA
jgi:hypothetical protein